MSLLGRFKQHFTSNRDAVEQGATFETRNEELARELADSQTRCEELARELTGSRAHSEELTRELSASQALNEKLTRESATSRARSEELSQELTVSQARVCQLEQVQQPSSAVDVNIFPMVPRIPETQRTPTIVRLLEIVQLLKEQAQALKDEIARLKGLKARPKLRPSKLTGSSSDNQGDDGKEGNGDTKGDKGKKGDKPARKKRPGSDKRAKTQELIIHETIKCPPDNIPEGSEFKGYEDFTVQDIIFKPHNTRYRLERWLTPSGETLMGKPPPNLAGGHFGPELVTYVLYQYHHAHVTQPLLLEQLLEIGVDISSGKLNGLLTDVNPDFHTEKEGLLTSGLEVSNYINVDDTGARHQGNNGFCTHVGNELFAYFESTASKSRINFLQILRGSHTDYVLNEQALDYMVEHKLPKGPASKLSALEQTRFADKSQWSAVLTQLGITGERHVRIATEGALVGSVLAHGFSPELVIISDDAGQFNVFLHALCWVHAERILAKLIGFNEEQKAALAQVRSQVWDLYRGLQAYKVSPNPADKKKLKARFEKVFGQKTCFETLNQALKRLRRNKKELLLVLERSEIALHNNLSENDIREYVKKRKISGSTRSNKGRRCRDTFASLKKTCRKHGISFWKYLRDRLEVQRTIPDLSELIRQRAAHNGNRCTEAQAEAA